MMVMMIVMMMVMMMVMMVSLTVSLLWYRNLVSLDLWRCRFAIPDTLHVLADNCPNLEELDIGWW